MQLEVSLPVLRGASGSMGLGEHTEHGHTKSPSLRPLISGTLVFGCALVW